MNQTLLRIGLPAGSVLYASQFRELMARDAGINPALFHSNDDGSPRAGTPSVRFVGAKGWVGILADEDAADSVYAAMGGAVKVATRFCGKTVRPAIEEHEFGIVRRDEPVRYRIREMALKKRHPHARERPIDELVVSRLCNGIERIARLHNLDCPTRSELDIQVNITSDIGMALSTTQGVTKEFVGLVNAEFMMAVDLKGIWFAGNLTSRGYGRIIKWHPGLQDDRVLTAARGFLR